MEIDKIVADLRRERDRLAKAIEALLGVGSGGNGRRRGRKPGTKMAGRKRRGGISKEGRKRLSELMKKRWAERRRKGLNRLAK